eukprot:773294-Alexandrium_andersonii.AAC.1
MRGAPWKLRGSPGRERRRRQSAGSPGEQRGPRAREDLLEPRRAGGRRGLAWEAEGTKARRGRRTWGRGGRHAAPRPRCARWVRKREVQLKGVVEEVVEH